MQFRFGIRDVRLRVDDAGGGVSVIGEKLENSRLSARFTASEMFDDICQYPPATWLATRYATSINHFKVESIP